MESKHKTDYGAWKLTAGKFYGDAEVNKGNSSVLLVCTEILSRTGITEMTLEAKNHC